jgi:hypothetical protein
MQTELLSGLITHKTFMSATAQTCYGAEHSSQLLKKAKSATYQSLQSTAATKTE